MYHACSFQVYTNIYSFPSCYTNMVGGRTWNLRMPYPSSFIESCSNK